MIVEKQIFHNLVVKPAAGIWESHMKVQTSAMLEEGILARTKGFAVTAILTVLKFMAPSRTIQTPHQIRGL